jgi:hypothetical protein
MDLLYQIIAIFISVTITALVTIFVTNKKIKASVLTINKQKWLDDFRTLLSEYLSSADMTSGMAIGFLNGDPIISRELAQKSYIDQLIKMTLAQEKLLLFLNDFSERDKKLIDLIQSYAFIIHDGSAHNNYETLDLTSHVGSIRKLGREIVNQEWGKITFNKKIKKRHIKSPSTS